MKIESRTQIHCPEKNREGRMDGWEQSKTFLKKENLEGRRRGTRLYTANGRRLKTFLFNLAEEVLRGSRNF